MKLSTKADYGLRFVVHLANNQGVEEYTRLHDVADKEGIPVKYLENIVAQLRPTNILRIKRGASGGYSLNQPPAQVSVFDLLVALDEPLVKNDGSQANDTRMTPLRAVVDKLWEGLNKQVTDYFRQLTLQDLLHQYRVQSNADVYYI